MRNIEIKAFLRDPDFVLSKAKELSGHVGDVIKQKDTFFVVEKGRLKLRQFSDGSGELIFYERSNSKGPRLSDYSKASFKDCGEIEELLKRVHGVLGIVEKTRILFLIGQSRVHIDEVKNLGRYVEIEVVLKDDQTVEVGQEINQNLMDQLQISSEDLISSAYIDLLSKSSSGDE